MFILQHQQWSAHCRPAAESESQQASTGPDGQGNAPEPQINTPPSRPRAPQYGYHNTFHLHAAPFQAPSQPPPSYEQATLKPLPRLRPRSDKLPRYKCTVHLEGQVGTLNELITPFLAPPPQTSHWQDVYAVLRGTQLRLYKLKVASGNRLIGKAKLAAPGKLVKSYSLQHAEVGLAADVKKGELRPKSALGKLFPPSARAKLYETDPHLFEPTHEFVIRLRVETEQILLSTRTQEEVLDWVEALASAIDISMPLDERSEPRYRSLPRRARRQREIEGRTSGDGRLNNLERRRSLVQQQERLFRALYPNLATENDEQSSGGDVGAQAGETDQQTEARRGEDADPDEEDLDRADALIPSTAVNTPAATRDRRSSYFTEAPNADSGRQTNLEMRAQSPSLSSSQVSAFASEILSTTRSLDSQSGEPSPDTPRTSVSAEQDSDAKPARRATPQLTASATLRYRRRCAPVLLASSPRASDVLVSTVVTLHPSGSSRPGSSDGRDVGRTLRRIKLDTRRHRAAPFDILPPRYDSHNFPPVKEEAVESDTEDAEPSPSVQPSRPPLLRGGTATSAVSVTSIASAATAESNRLSSTRTLSAQSTSTDGDALTLSTLPSSRSEVSLADSANVRQGLDGSSSSGDSTTSADNDSGGDLSSASDMERCGSRTSIADKKSGPPTPTRMNGTGVTTLMSVSKVDKKAVRLSLHAKILEKKMAERQKIVGKPGNRASQTHSGSGRADHANAGAEATAFAALLF